MFSNGLSTLRRIFPWFYNEYQILNEEEDSVQSTLNVEVAREYKKALTDAESYEKRGMLKEAGDAHLRAALLAQSLKMKFNDVIFNGLFNKAVEFCIINGYAYNREVDGVSIQKYLYQKAVALKLEHNLPHTCPLITVQLDKYTNALQKAKDDHSKFISKERDISGIEHEYTSLCRNCIDNFEELAYVFWYLRHVLKRNIRLISTV
ncbi:hypothetical protein RF11_07675 [Thelohanellus kitauei]|uniref:Uncharacterized protein n=1 Tax=Thelohanellus kitauei TaxID=669202 RepID=A0A0C2MT19_THEKT|nr:hypothetical protein RF11_07675 [Thelohanellus kitauei]